MEERKKTEDKVDRLRCGGEGKVFDPFSFFLGL